MADATIVLEAIGLFVSDCRLKRMLQLPTKTISHRKNVKGAAPKANEAKKQAISYKFVNTEWRLSLTSFTTYTTLTMRSYRYLLLRALLLLHAVKCQETCRTNIYTVGEECCN